MADVVQQVLEDMVPELEDLEKKQIFSKNEIRSLTSKRRHYEYQLRKRGALKQDFLKYVDYEMKMDKLRRIRKAKIGITKTSTSDYAPARRIHFIFERATRKFKEDINIWLQWIDFAMRQGSTRALGKIFVRALQIHPRNDGLWVYAASYEYEANNNISTARTFLQRGIRLNKSSERLWQQFFRLELMYLEKVVERRKVLRGEADEDRIEAEDLPPRDTSDEPAATDAQNAFMEGAIPWAIYRNAVKAMPESHPFRLGFWRISQTYSKILPTLPDKIEDDIRGDFGDDPQCCAAFITSPLEDIPAGTPMTTREPVVAEVIRDFEKAVTKMKSSEMWNLFIGFLRRELLRREEPESRRELAEKTAAACSKAVKSEEIFVVWVQMLLLLNQKEKAEKVAKEAVSNHATSLDLWVQLLSLNPDSDLFIECLDNLRSADERAKLVSHFVDVSIGRGSATPEEVEELLRVDILNGQPGVQIPLLKWIFHTYGIVGCRRAFARWKQMPHLDVSVVRECIRMELSVHEVDAQRIRSLFGLAIEKDLADPELWREAVLFERESGDVLHASKLARDALSHGHHIH